MVYGDGPHRLWGCEFRSRRIKEIESITHGVQDFLLGVANAGRSEPRRYFEDRYGHSGITAMLTIGDSSVVYHSWPERDYGRVVYDTCSAETDFGEVKTFIDKFMETTSKEIPLQNLAGPYGPLPTFSTASS